MTRLAVELHGEVIGSLDDDAGVAAFRPDRSWARRPGRPILSQFLEDRGYDEVYRGPGIVPSFFANLEPDGPVERWLARRHRVGLGPLELLGAIGDDLPGAVRLRPVEALEARLRHVVSPPAPRAWSWSLPGVQMKLPASLDKDDRVTLPLAGELAAWILKIPPSGRYAGLAENEHATMSWARAAGFDVPETAIRLPPAEAIADGDVPRPSLLVRRFDRTADGAVHQEDFCQLLGLDPVQKYPVEVDRTAFDVASEQIRARATRLEGLARITRVLLGETGAMELLRRVVLVVATGNDDCHLKNWAILYRDRRTPAWSPLYDQVSTVAWGDGDLCLPLYGKRNFSGVHRADLVRLGEEAGLSSAAAGKLIDETVDTLCGVLDTAQAAAPYPARHLDRVRHHWSSTVPLLRRHRLPG